MSSLARRGQAWVVFHSIDAAKSAADSLHGTVAFGKKLRVSFSRNMSDITRDRKGLPSRVKRTQPLIKANQNIEKTRNIGKQADQARTSDEFFRPSSAPPKVPSSTTFNPPHRVLLVENVPEGSLASDLVNIFAKSEGYIEVRFIPTRGVAFVEYENERFSRDAITMLQGYEIKPGMHLSISYAKR